MMKIMIKCKLLVFWILVTLFFLPSYLLADDPWPMAFHDEKNSSFSSFAISDKALLEWNVEFLSGGAPEVNQGIAISESGVMYVCSTDHYIYAIHSSDGSIQWKYLTQHELVGSPAIDTSGNIYAGSKDDYLYCLKPGGTLEYKVKLDSDPVTSPLTSNQGYVFIATDKRLYAINPDGSQAWTDSGDQENGLALTRLTGMPAIATDGTMFVTTGRSQDGAKLVCLTYQGTVLWTKSIGWGANNSSPAIGNTGNVYYISNLDELHAITPDGTPLWTYTFADQIAYSQPAIGSDDTIYIGCADYYVYAISADGTLKWKYLMPQSMDGSRIAVDPANASIIFPSHNNTGYAFNADGTLRWTFEYQANSYFIQHVHYAVITSNEKIVLGYGRGIALLGESGSIQNNQSTSGQTGGATQDSGGGGCFLEFLWP